jgi:hypothetical protein
MNLKMNNAGILEGTVCINPAIFLTRVMLTMIIAKDM